MGLSWSDLRALNGSRRKGFEEVCAQLAQLETPAGAEFVRKGSPDAGVECFCKLEDGGEWGWQAKFFRESLGDGQWRQIDRSVKRALLIRDWSGISCVSRVIVLTAAGQALRLRCRSGRNASPLGRAGRRNVGWRSSLCGGAHLS